MEIEIVKETFKPFDKLASSYGIIITINNEYYFLPVVSKKDIENMLIANIVISPHEYLKDSYYIEYYEEKYCNNRTWSARKISKQTAFLMLINED